MYREGAETALFYQALFNEGTRVALPITLGVLVGGVVLVCTVDPSNTLDRFVGLPVVDSLDAIEGHVDGVMVTAVFSTPAIDALIDGARKKFGPDAVLIPELVDLHPRKAKEHSVS